MDEHVHRCSTLPGDARLEIRLDHYTECSLDSQRNSNSERSNTAVLYLRSHEEQKIFSEVQVKNHLWSALGKVRGVMPISSMVVHYVTLYVHVQPALNAEESATLEVNHIYQVFQVVDDTQRLNHTHSDTTCFEIGPSSIPCRKYGPYNIILKTTPVVRFNEKLALTLRTEKVGDLNCVSLTEKQLRPSPINTFFLSYSNELFQNQELSDVTLKIRGKEFPAHKLLLSSFSPVFKTMFLSDFRESRSNVVEIKDFEFEVIQEMLKFIYTHKPPQFRSPDGNIDTLSLYKASHKYEIQYLLESCREELLSTIDIESALDVLLLADIYEDAFLKEKALNFICKNPPAVDDVSKYEEIVRQRPGLMKDILTCKFKQK